MDEGSIGGEEELESVLSVGGTCPVLTSGGLASVVTWRPLVSNAKMVLRMVGTDEEVDWFEGIAIAPRAAVAAVAAANLASSTFFSRWPIVSLSDR